MKTSGKFITLEGPEGCGKSTHARMLYEYLKGAGYRCVLTREPGGTAFGERVRKILLDPSNRGMTLDCETLLFEASRAALVDEVIAPALAKGFIVLCDRFSDATMVYQGLAGGQDIKKIETLDERARRGIKPCLTITLDIEAGEGLRRAKRAHNRKRKIFKWDRVERRPLAYHRRVRRGYLKIAALEKNRVKVIRTHSDINLTQKLIRRVVEAGIS